jgi:hypothetical protein
MEQLHRDRTIDNEKIIKDLHPDWVAAATNRGGSSPSHRRHPTENQDLMGRLPAKPLTPCSRVAGIWQMSGGHLAAGSRQVCMNEDSGRSRPHFRGCRRPSPSR